MKNRLFFIVCAAMFTFARPAAAQTPAGERPYRGLFGGGAQLRETPLTITIAVGSGYDTNVLLDPTGSGTGVVDPRVSRSAGFGSLNAGLDYSRTTDRVALAVSAGTATRYHPASSEFIGTHHGSVGASYRFSRTTVLNASQSVSYQPFLTIDVFPQLGESDLGLQEPTTHDRGTLRVDYLTYQSVIGARRQVSRRGSLVVGYNFQLSDFTALDSDFTAHGTWGRYLYALGRGVALRLGYGYRAAHSPQLGEGRHVASHDIDTGIDYSRALSLSRRTTLSFSSGLSVLSDTVRTYYNVIGNARLNHQMGRTWNADIAYNRSVGFLAAFAEPVFGDSITIGLTGMPGRRLQFRSRVGASLGDLGVASAGAGGFDSYVASSGLDVALTRHLALGVDYSYYRYTFESGAVLPLGLPSDIDRQSVQAYLSVWLPIGSHIRRPNVAR
jgi:hypothetical protein